MARGGIPLLVRSGRNPFEVLMLAACLCTGVVGLFEPATTSGAIVSLLPHWQVVTWYCGLVVGGAIGIGGVFSRGISSLAIERAGLIVLTCLTLAYAGAVVAQVGIRGTLPALFTGLFAVACAVRCVYITADLKRMEDIATKQLDGDE